MFGNGKSISSRKVSQINNKGKYKKNMTRGLAMHKETRTEKTRAHAFTHTHKKNNETRTRNTPFWNLAKEH